MFLQHDNGISSGGMYASATLLVDTSCHGQDAGYKRIDWKRKNRSSYPLKPRVKGQPR